MPLSACDQFGLAIVDVLGDTCKRDGHFTDFGAD